MSDHADQIRPPQLDYASGGYGRGWRRWVVAAVASVLLAGALHLVSFRRDVGCEFGVSARDRVALALYGGTVNVHWWRRGVDPPTSPARLVRQWNIAYEPARYVDYWWFEYRLRSRTAGNPADGFTAYIIFPVLLLSLPLALIGVGLHAATGRLLGLVWRRRRGHRPVKTLEQTPSPPGV